MRKLSRRDLARAERELERIGLLLLHDASLPSFTGLVVGAPFRGSWWAHPQTHEIYDLLQGFQRGCGVLSVKLVNGKVTYVHRRLWAALLGVARGRAAWQRDGLSAEAQAVRAAVQRRGAVRSDELAKAPSARRGAAIRQLETRLLVHSSSVHTETGAHRKLLRSWSRWRADESYSARPLSPARARIALDEAAERLTGHDQLTPPRGVRSAALPWS